MTDPDAALQVCQLLHDASLVLVWGASSYLAWLVPRDLADSDVRRLYVPCIVAIAIAIATMLVALPIETALIGGRLQ